MTNRVSTKISLAIKQSCKVWDRRLAVSHSPGSWLSISERPFARPRVVYLGHLEDILVAGLGGGGGREPGAEPLPPVGEPLEVLLPEGLARLVVKT